MIVTDIYLKASGKIALDNAIQAAGLMDNEGNLTSHLTALDHIGEIEGAEGWHANLRLLFEPTAEQIEALYPVTILPPATPRRVWA